MSDTRSFSDPDDDHFAEIGRVASAWANFEATLDSIAHGLAGIDLETGTCLTAQVIGHARKLDAVIALMAHKGLSKPLVKKMNQFAEKARGIAERRNRVVHDPWKRQAVDDGEVFVIDNGLLKGVAIPKNYLPARYELSARRKVVAEYVVVPTREISALRREIRELERELWRLIIEFEEQPSPEK